MINEGIPEERVEAVPTGVDIGIFSPENATNRLRQKFEIGKETRIVGTVSILRRKKGHHILLEAVPMILEKMPDLIFFIAGDGPQHENIKSLIYEMGLQDKVFMLGIRDDIPDILKSIDLFVLPTLQEALGTSFIEAMAMGKPVIGCDVGGVNEVIKDGVNGYLIKPGDPSDLAEAVIKIFSDYDKLIEMGNNGRKIVLEKFTTSRMCSDMFRLYSSLLKGRR